MPSSRRRASGFTLIEIAIVVFIAGILLSVMITVVTGLVERTRTAADASKGDAIKIALSTYFAREFRLPCPAVITLASGAVNDGIADTTTDGFGACAATIRPAPYLVATGAIPWRTLGLPEESSINAYGHRFTYQVTRTATTLSSQTASGMQGVITIHSAGLGTAGNQTNNCLVAPSMTNPCAAVLVVVSHGKNGFGAYSQSGLQIPFNAEVTGNDEKENSNADNKFVVKSYSENVANPYDDNVIAITSGDFLTPLAAQGTLKDWRSQYNEAINVIKNNVIADAYNNGNSSSPPPPRTYMLPNTSGGGSFNWATMPPQYQVDPWGNPYTYTQLIASVRCDTGSAGNAFRITSRGPDGVAGNGDDISTTVSVAEIQAIIAKAGCNN